MCPEEKYSLIEDREERRSIQKCVVSKQCSLDHAMVTFLFQRQALWQIVLWAPNTTQALLPPHNGVLAGHTSKAPLNVGLASDESSSKQAGSWSFQESCGLLFLGPLHLCNGWHTMNVREGKGPQCLHAVGSWRPPGAAAAWLCLPWEMWPRWFFTAVEAASYLFLMTETSSSHYSEAPGLCKRLLRRLPAIRKMGPCQIFIVSRPWASQFQ